MSEELNKILNKCLEKFYDENNKNTRISIDVNPNNMT